MKKNILLLLTALMMIFIVNAFQIEAKAAPQINLTVQSGIDGIQQSGKNLPIVVKIVNSGEEFKGDVLINAGYTTENAHGLVKSVHLNPGEEKTIRFLAQNFTTQEGPSKIRLFEGTVKDGTEISYSGNGTIPNPKVDEYQPIILSLNYTKKQIDALTLEMTEQESFFYKNSNNFNAPTDARYLDAISLLMVQDDVLMKWSGEQQDALLEWIKQGGKLYLQGDAKVPQNLDAYLPLKITSEKETLSSNDVNEFLGTNNSDALVLNKAALNQSANILLGNSESLLLGEMPVGSGSIIQANTTDNLLATTTFLDSTVSQLQQDEEHGFEESSLSTSNATFPDFYFSAIILMITLLVYVVLIAPLLYVVLKKKDKREYAWWIIPSGAIITSLGIFFVSSSGRLTQSMVQQSSVTVINDSQANTIFSQSVLTNKAGDFTVSAPADVYLSRTINQSKTNQFYKNAILKQTKETSALELENIRYWDVATINGEKIVDEFGQMDTNLKISKGYLTGEVTNELPYDLKDVEVWSASNKYKIGSIKKNETITVNEKVEEQFLKQPTRNDYESIEPPSNKKELKTYQRESILYVGFDLISEKEQPVIVGWMDKDLIGATYQNLKIEQTNNSLVVQNFVPGVEIESQFEVKDDSFSPSVTDIDESSYSEVSSELNEWYFDKGNYYIDYKIPAAIPLDEVKWTELQFRYTPTATTAMQIYNYEQKKFEDLQEKQTTFKENSADYISQTGQIRIKVKKKDAADGTVRKPMLQLKGAKLND